MHSRLKLWPCMSSRLLPFLMFMFLIITNFEPVFACKYSGCCPWGMEEYWHDDYTGDCMQCRPCPAGYTSSGCPGHNACYQIPPPPPPPPPDCAAGFTGPAGACSACVAGKYKTTTGAAVCTDCAAGKYLTTTGATAASSCVDCDAGKYNPNPGASLTANCQNCPQFTQSPAASTAKTSCVCNTGYTGPKRGGWDTCRTSDL